MNPLVFTILAWEKELEIREERKSIRRILPEFPPSLDNREKEAPVDRAVGWKRTTTTPDCEPSRDCACIALD